MSVRLINFLYIIPSGHMDATLLLILIQKYSLQLKFQTKTSCTILNLDINLARLPFKEDKESRWSIDELPVEKMID